MVEPLVVRCLCIAFSLIDQLINPKFGERIDGSTVSIGISANTAIQATARVVTSVDPPSTQTWLSIIAASTDWIAVVGHDEVCVPPTAAHCHQQLDCVLVALRFRPDIAKQRLLVLALRIQQIENPGRPIAISKALQTHGL
jgi:hypothetical protein